MVNLLGEQFLMLTQGACCRGIASSKPDSSTVMALPLRQDCQKIAITSRLAPRKCCVDVHSWLAEHSNRA